MKKIRNEKKPKKPREKKGPRYVVSFMSRGRAAKTDEAPAPEPGFSVGAVSAFPDDGFIAGVRSEEPVLSVDDAAAGSRWKQDLVPNLAGAALLMAFMSLFAVAAEAYDIVPFLIPGAVLYTGLTTAGSVRPGKLRWIISAVVLVLLIVLLIVFRHAIGGGLAAVINQFYDIAEEAQAYRYTRIPGGGDGDGRAAAAWLSCLLGLLASLPPAAARRGTMYLIALIMMFAFAYYGLIPSWICVAAFLAALLIGVSKGNILSALPMLLMVMLVFGAIVFIDPGENYTISLLDENFRDRFAFRSLLIENEDMSTTDPSDYENLAEQENENYWDDSEYDSPYGRYAAIGIAVLIAAALAAAVYLLWRRINNRRRAVRAGIDSSDPREAVTAMFPYSVRWLKAGGVETGRLPFDRLASAVEAQYSKDYADRYRDMYLLWREAAYSDHAIEDTDRNDMERFVKDTTGMVKERFTLRDRLNVLVKYSL